MTKYYVEFVETQIHTYGYYTEADSPEEAFDNVEDKYYDDVEPPDSTQMIDSRYIRHTVEEY